MFKRIIRFSPVSFWARQSVPWVFCGSSLAVQEIQLVANRKLYCVAWSSTISTFLAPTSAGFVL